MSIAIGGFTAKMDKLIGQHIFVVEKTDGKCGNNILF